MKVRMGIVGLGRLGKIHAENLAQKVNNCELIAATSVVSSELEWAKETLKVPFTYDSFEEMVENPEIDAVFIVSPSGLHPQQIRLALEKGKHVFSEKPIGLDLDEIKQLVPFIDKATKKFMLGFMRRFDDSYQDAKHRIDEGDIGEITLIRSYSIDPSAGMPSFVKFAKNSNSGGVFSDMSIHDIDLIRWLSNTQDVGIKRVWALGNNIAYPELTELGELETGVAMMELENNKIALLVAGRNAAHGYHVETEIIGTKGTIRIGTVPEKNLVIVMNESGIVRPTSQNFPERFGQAFLSEAQYFVDAILNDWKIPINAEDGLYATRVALGLQESYESGGIITL